MSPRSSRTHSGTRSRPPGRPLGLRHGLCIQDADGGRIRGRLLGDAVRLLAIAQGRPGPGWRTGLPLLSARPLPDACIRCEQARDRTHVAGPHVDRAALAGLATIDPRHVAAPCARGRPGPAHPAQRLAAAEPGQSASMQRVVRRVSHRGGLCDVHDTLLRVDARKVPLPPDCGAHRAPRSVPRCRLPASLPLQGHDSLEFASELREAL